MSVLTVTDRPLFVNLKPHSNLFVNSLDIRKPIAYIN